MLRNTTASARADGLAWQGFSRPFPRRQSLPFGPPGEREAGGLGHPMRNGRYTTPTITILHFARRSSFWHRSLARDVARLAWVRVCDVDEFLLLDCRDASLVGGRRRSGLRRTFVRLLCWLLAGLSFLRSGSLVCLDHLICFSLPVMSAR
jgi:hypothetical protein